jgi:protein-disulfide isomerase
MKTMLNSMIPLSSVRAALDLISTLAITIAACGVAWMTFTFKQPSAAPNGRAARSAPTWERVSGIEMSLQHGAIKRSVAEGVVFIEFADFECPFCARFATETHPRLWNDFVASNRMTYVFRHFPLEAIHPKAMGAAAAAFCAGEQGQFWGMHKLLFSQPRRLAEQDLRTLAGGLNLNMVAFQQCTESTAEQRVREDQADAARLGIKSTPTFMLGRAIGERVVILSKLEGAASYEVVKSGVDRRLDGER